jgi:hypothetical protein
LHGPRASRLRGRGPVVGRPGRGSMGGGRPLLLQGHPGRGRTPRKLRHCQSLTRASPSPRRPGNAPSASGSSASCCADGRRCTGVGLAVSLDGSIAGPGQYCCPGTSGPPRHRIRGLRGRKTTCEQVELPGVTVARNAERGRRPSTAHACLAQRIA